MKLSNIKVGRIYTFKNIDSLRDSYNGEKIIIREIEKEDKITVDFVDYKEPHLIDASIGKIEYRPLIGMVISAYEVRR